MLELHKLLWVIPGVVFIHVYNKRRPIDSISLSGWPYLFSLVIIAVFMWLPVEILFQDKLNSFGKWHVLVIPSLSGLLSFFTAILFTSSATIKWFNWPSFFILSAIAFLIWFFIGALFYDGLSFFETWRIWLLPVFSGLLLFVLIPKISNIIFFNAQDDFLTNCAQWKNSLVISSLRNDKIYVGILLEYPKNPRTRHESQTISIMPLVSGGRDKDTKEVIWGDSYPKESLHGAKIFIPRSEIISFGRFNRRIFKHFQKNNGKSHAYIDHA